MAKVTFDLDVLRTFVTGIELGSFAKAADRLGRSTSAVSAQLKKLEDQVGSPILRKSGRGMTPTAAGETLLAYGRRLLELNDEAATAVRGVDLEGWIRLGIAEDFGERILTDVLGRFARAHPKVRIEARVTRNTPLLEQITNGKLDLALTWDAGISTPHVETICNYTLHWIAADDSNKVDKLPAFNTEHPLPLITLDAPCLMRNIATAALDRANIPWRLVFTSPSLSGTWAAVAAGLGITIRTEIGLPHTVRLLDDNCGLPPLPRLGLSLHRAEAEPDTAVQRLREIILETITGIEQRTPMGKLAA